MPKYDPLNVQSGNWLPPGNVKKEVKMPKLKTKSYLKKRASMTATGKIRVARNAHKKLLRHKSKRANNAGSKPQYLNENMVGQAKILAPYGLK